MTLRERGLRAGRATCRACPRGRAEFRRDVHRRTAKAPSDGRDVEGGTRRTVGKDRHGTVFALSAIKSTCIWNSGTPPLVLLVVQPPPSGEFDPSAIDDLNDVPPKLLGPGGSSQKFSLHKTWEFIYRRRFIFMKPFRRLALVLAMFLRRGRGAAQISGACAETPRAAKRRWPAGMVINAELKLFH